MSTAIPIPDKTSIHLLSSPLGEGLPSNPPSSSPSAQLQPSSTSMVSTDGSRPRVGEGRSSNTHNLAVIPPSTTERLEHRTIVLCFDGMGDQSDNNSNVIQFFEALNKEREQQLVYYQAGFGTDITSSIRSIMTKTLEMVFASSLGHHIVAGYEFLMEHYRRGDKICILGSSRGAYTGRALAGMIEKVGLLPAGSHHQVPYAYKLYMEDNESGRKRSAEFKEFFSSHVDVEFVGVWDAVDSVGIIPRHAPFTKYNTCVKTFRHAISLDEQGAKFKANMYDKCPNEPTANYDPSPQCPHDHNAKGKKRAQIGQDQFIDRSTETDVLEVWFAGCHSDVGGGSVTSGTRNSLARIPLRWMIRQCFLTNCGIQFRTEKLREVGLDPNMLYPVVKARPPPVVESAERSLIGSKDKNDEGAINETVGEKNHGMDDMDANEEYEELCDALSPIHDDRLDAGRTWCNPVYLLFVHRVQTKDGSNGKVLSINNGRPRKHVQDHPIKVHRSVLIRMEAKHLPKPYTPRLKFEVEQEWVD